MSEFLIVLVFTFGNFFYYQKHVKGSKDKLSQLELENTNLAGQCTKLLQENAELKKRLNGADT